MYSLVQVRIFDWLKLAHLHHFPTSFSSLQIRLPIFGVSFIVANFLFIVAFFIGGVVAIFKGTQEHDSGRG
jgi:hypothetical protein